MTITTRTTRSPATIAGILLLAALAACGEGSKHRDDADTGAAAPATVPDLSATPRVGDSTPGVAKATGEPDAASGDTMGTRAKAAQKGKPATKP